MGPLVHRLALTSLSHTGQGIAWFSYVPLLGFEPETLVYQNTILSYYPVRLKLLFFKLYLFLERRREGKREGEKC